MLKDCCLLNPFQKMEKKACGVGDCKGQHSYLLHSDQNKVSVNMYSVLEEDDQEDKPAYKDKDGQEEETLGERLMRGILAAGGSQEEKEDTSSEEEDSVEKEAVTALEEETKLEPEKEKNTLEEEKADYCSMEAIAERWTDKPRSAAASVESEAGKESERKPVASVSGVRTQARFLLLSEMAEIEGELAVIIMTRELLHHWLLLAS